MLKTRFTEMFDIKCPIALGGLGGGHTKPEIVAAVSDAGGFGAQGCHGLDAAAVRSAAAEIRQLTDKPFALNFLMFLFDEDAYSAALDVQPAAIALAWPRGDQDLKPYIDRAHDAGCKVTLMAGGVPEAVKGAEAGADIIIAQGTEGGGHVGWMATIALTPMVVDAVAPIPVLSAGGIADGRGLVAALALGAEGALMGTRFLATPEAPMHDNFKQAILDSDGHDTILTEISDIVSGTVWPGAMSRAARNKFIERWAGQEWALREHQAEAFAGVIEARKIGDTAGAPLSYGQDAGLINDISPAGDLVRRINDEAENLLSGRMPGLIA